VRITFVVLSVLFLVFGLLTMMGGDNSTVGLFLLGFGFVGIGFAAYMHKR
jgi:hypothetical protein